MNDVKGKATLVFATCDAGIVSVHRLCAIFALFKSISTISFTANAKKSYAIFLVRPITKFGNGVAFLDSFAIYIVNQIDT